MFQFPRCPLRDRSQSARPCAGRVAPFGDPRITDCQRLPGAFRRVAASFLGRQRQGIHHAPISAKSDVVPIQHLSWPRQQTGTRPRDDPPGTAARRRPATPLDRPRCCPPTAGVPGGSGRGEGKNRGRCLLFLRLSVAFNAVRAGDPPRARSPHRSGCGEEFKARDVRAGLACLPRPQNPTGSAWRVVKVREREEPSRQGGSPL